MTPSEDRFEFGSTLSLRLTPSWSRSVPGVDNLQHSLFSDVGWRSTSQKSSDNTLRRLLPGLMVRMRRLEARPLKVVVR